MNSTIQLKLYSSAIKNLHDPNWTGLDLYYKLKQHLRGITEPSDLLFKTIKNGLLFHIGKWIYEDFFEFDEGMEEFEYEGEYLMWFLEDFGVFLIDCGVNEKDSLLVKLFKDAEMFRILYFQDEEKYFKRLSSKQRKLRKLVIKLSTTYRDIIEKNKSNYAQIFAERVFHDRILCEYISQLMLGIGFDGAKEEYGKPEQWIKRGSFPEWAKKAVISRDRGRCAQCNKNVIMELDANHHFDHIVPLFKGGTNDLSNFQLLCDDCNWKKSKNIVAVNSSVPQYLQTKKK